MQRRHLSESEGPETTVVQGTSPDSTSPESIFGQTGFSLLDTPQPDLYSACVHCGFCLEVCPTYQELSDENHSPRGRVYLIKQASEGALELDESVVDPVFTCLDCRACETVCPSGVQVGSLIEQARGQVHKSGLPRGVNTRVERLFLRGLFPHPKRLHLVHRALRLYQQTGIRVAARKLGLLNILPHHVREMEAILPPLRDSPALISLPEHMPASLAPIDANPKTKATSKGLAALFTGCVMDVFFSSINKATARVAVKNGLDVVVPRQQVCCGALQVHAGDREQARKLARHNIDTFLSSGADYVVVNAAGCGAALKEYPDLFGSDLEYQAKAERFSDRVRDIAEVLVEVGFIPPKGAVNQTVTYHDACHLCHAQQVQNQPRELLNSIPGLQLVEMPDASRCCGSAGIYNLTHPEMASQLLERKMDDIPERVDLVAMGNPGCMLQISLGVQRRGRRLEVRHTVELLDEAYSREERDGKE